MERSSDRLTWFDINTVWMDGEVGCGMGRACLSGQAR